MSTGRRIQNLALIGFMGTGKSSVGRQVADLLNFTCLDTDELIETRAGRTVNEIFAKDGEPAFREMERKIVEELATRTRTIICTGGGLPINPVNLERLKTYALVVCLWASPEKIFERVGDQTHRPLLNGADPLTRIRTLLSAREKFYRAADVLINTEMRSVKEVAQQVVYQFRQAQPQPR